MSLDDRLENIIGNRRIHYKSDESARITAQIKQAFADDPKWVEILEEDDWADPTAAGTTIQRKKGYLSGQEWYDRFVESLDDEFHFVSKPSVIDSSVYYDAPNVMKAAKRAAGLEEKNNE